MKAFHLTTYKLYRPKQPQLKVAMLSDVHFSPQVSDAKLQSITHFFQRRQPDYILLAGDLYDSNNCLDDPHEAKRLLRWLRQLAQVAPVLYAFGNHEFLRDTGTRRPRWYYQENQTFWQQIAQIPNLHLLHNAHYADRQLYAVGLTQDRDYYDFEFNGAGSSLFHPKQENKSAFLRSLTQQKSQLTHLPPNKLKFALIHSPVYLSDIDVKAQLQEFDFVISGHMHNGVVPPLVNELVPNQKGIVAPTKQLAPSYARNTFKKYGDQLIVLGPVTTFHACTGALSHFNAFYPTYLSMLEFTHDPKYARKPYIQRKYLGST